MRNFHILSVSMAASLSAHTALAAPEVQIGAEYQFRLLHTDDGLNPDAAQKKESDFGLRDAKLLIKGKLAEDLTLNVTHQLDKSTGALERFWLTKNVTESLDVLVGLQKTRIYGWHRRITGYQTAVKAPYLDFNPMANAVAANVTYKAFGEVTLGLVKDYFDKDEKCKADRSGCTSFNGSDVQKQPAVSFEWIGSFGDVKPLLQYTSYDMNHSKTASAGVRFKNQQLDAHLDYTLDERLLRDPTTGIKEDESRKITGIVAYGEYNLGSFTPYLHFSTLDYDQGVKDVKTNDDGKLNDNEQTIALGSFYNGFGDSYRPYLAVAQTTGDYKSVDDPDATVERSRLEVMLALTGKF